MSRWLSNVNNFLEALDDQVENVRDVLAERQDDYYTTESDDDDDDDDSVGDEEDEASEEEEEIDGTDEEEEEEEIDLEPPHENESLFAASPARLAATEAPVSDATNISKDSAAKPSSPAGAASQAPPAQKSSSTTSAAKPSSTNHGKPVTNAKSTPSQQPTLTPAKTTTTGPKPPPKPTTTQENPGTVSTNQGPAVPAKNHAAATTTTTQNAKPPTTKPQSTPAVAVKYSQPIKPINNNKTAAPPPPKGVPPQPKQAAPQKKPTAPPKQSAPAPPPKKQSAAPPPPSQKLAAPLSRGSKPTTAAKAAAAAPVSSGTSSNNAVTKQMASELRQLKKQLAQSQQELKAAHREIQAQQRELDSAATIVERERAELKEEKEELLEDHEEELLAVKQDYDDKIAAMRTKHQQQLAALEQQLKEEKAQHEQEGGDLSQDLREALEREKLALQQVAALGEDKAQLQSQVQKLTTQQESLQERLEAALSSQTAAVQRQQDAEVALDDAQDNFKRQLKQKQQRETELEQTIAELGAALTAAQQQPQQAASSANDRTKSVVAAVSDGAASSVAEDSAALRGHYKEQYELAMEEVETLRGQLNLESQRCDALRQQLSEINQERTEETAASQKRQRHYDQKLSEQASIIARLESTLHDLQPAQSDASSTNGDNNEISAATVQRLQKQVDDGKQQITQLSEQLLRQQGQSDVHKSEILALKGRLQSALARAEEAERTTFASPTSASAYESEGGATSSGNFSGGYKMRRRVKGRGGTGMGSSRGGSSVTVKSIRAALNMGPGSSMEGLGKTVDALDSWMIDTGYILRHEPLARLAFFVYFSILHLWCFCLVIFHAPEHHGGDFPSGSLRGHLVKKNS